MTIDRRMLHDKLTDEFARFFAQEQQPGLEYRTAASVLNLYRNDLIVRAKTQCLVASVMWVIDECETEENRP